MKALILAGGGGSRLWPLSDNATPKQFIRFDGQFSLLQKTLLRCDRMGLFDEAAVVTSAMHEDLVRQHVAEITLNIPVLVIAEPERRNTAPAIALGVQALTQSASNPNDVVISVFPSDHEIPTTDWPILAKRLSHAGTLARSGSMVIFGIVPTAPETGYGYIQIEDSLKNAEIPLRPNYDVQRFVEKPNSELAEQYVSCGSYLWNSGMFIFSATTLTRELAENAPEIHALTQAGTWQDTLARFAEMPSISFDYAVMEKTGNAQVIPLDVLWSDLGCWESIYHHLANTSEQHNVIQGPTADQVVHIDTENSLIYACGQNKQIATLGLRDVVIIDTPHALLVADRAQSQQVKDVLTAIENLTPKTSVDNFVGGSIETVWHRPSGMTAQDPPLYLIRMQLEANRTMLLAAPVPTVWTITRGTLTLEDGPRVLGPGDILTITGPLTLKTGSNPAELHRLSVDPNVFPHPEALGVNVLDTTLV